jgi:hypothetical protein
MRKTLFDAILNCQNINSQNYTLIYVKQSTESSIMMKGVISYSIYFYKKHHLFLWWVKWWLLMLNSGTMLCFVDIYTPQTQKK